MKQHSPFTYLNILVLLFCIATFLVGGCKKQEVNGGNTATNTIDSSKGKPATHFKSYIYLFDSTFSGAIIYPDGTYYPSGKSYPLSYVDSILFDTLGVNKYLIMRRDTFYRNWVAPNYQSFTCKGASKSFGLYYNSNGGNEVRLYIINDTLSIHSTWHSRWSPASFVVQGILK